MKIEVKGVGNVTVPPESRVSDVVRDLNHHLDAVIVVKDGKPVPLDEQLKNGDTLKVLSVVSGG
ncbi:MAG: MoaD/ThiS family protein [Thermoplasmata archaeon]